MIELKDVLALLDGELLTPPTSPETAFRTVFASDLMSDVLTLAEPGSLLLTGLANAHVVCTCSVVDALRPSSSSRASARRQRHRRGPDPEPAPRRHPDDHVRGLLADRRV